MKTKMLQPTEHEIQRGITKWASMQSATVPALNMLFAIPNGGWRHPVTAAKLVAEGVKAGVPDMFLAHPARKSQEEYSTHGGANYWHGLFLEVKRGTMGRVREQQALWCGALRQAGYRVEVVRSVGDAIETIKGYLNNNNT